MIAYFKNIWDTYTSILEGMAITFSYLLQKPITVQYPDRLKKPVPDTLPDKYRGRLAVDVSICTACGLCAKACPIDIIDIKGVRTERKKGLTLAYFNIYQGKCMYCNFCVEACPAEHEDQHHTAIYFKKNFEGAGYTVNDMIERFVPLEESQKIVKEAEELAAKRAAAKASEEKKDNKPEGSAE